MIYVPDNPFLWAIIFTTGAVIGSFLNVVIYRWPRQESIVHPPSHCMSCGARLGIIDLFPILSYMLLRGRCRHCGHTYSPRYAFVELITGLMLVGSVALFGASWHALLTFVVCCCLVLVFFIDLDHMIIPDELIIVIAVVGFVLNVYDLLHHGVGGVQPGMISASGAYRATNALVFTQTIADKPMTIFLPASIVGIVLGGGAFLFVSSVFEALFRKPVLGFGDVKLAAAMGALFGPGYLFVSWFLISVVTGAFVAVLLMALKIRKRREYIPFGPMLAVGGVLLLLFPELGALVISQYGG